MVATIFVIILEHHVLVPLTKLKLHSESWMILAMPCEPCQLISSAYFCIKTSHLTFAGDFSTSLIQSLTEFFLHR